MDLRKKYHHILSFLLQQLMKAVVRLLGFLLTAVVLILLMQFLFPDYVRVFNEDITEKSARKLLDNYRYNELLWLLDRKQPTLDKMKPVQQSFFHYMKGEAYSFIGEYQKSEEAYQRMAELYYQRYDKGDWHEIVILVPLAAFNFRIGNYEESLRYCEKIRELFPKLPPKMSKQYNRLGCYLTILNIYVKQGKPDKIIDLLDQISNEYEEMPVTLQEFKSIAYLMKQDTVRARQIWNSIDLKELSPAQQISGFFLFNDFANANSAVRKQLKVAEKMVGKEHALYAEALSYAIQYDLEEKKYEEAYLYITQNNRILQEQFERNFIFMSEQQQQYFHAKYHAHFDLAYVLQQVSPQPEWADLCYDNALFLKGLLLRSQNRFRNSLAQSVDTTLLSMYEHWISLKQTAASLEVSPSLVDRVKSRLKEEQAEKLAKELSRRTEDWQKQQRLSATNWTDIRSSLSQGETAIEFVVYSWQKQTWYAALLLQPGMQHPLQGRRIKKRYSLKALKGSFHPNRLLVFSNLSSLL